MVKIKWSHLYQMLATDASLRGSNDCFEDGTVNSLIWSKPRMEKNAKVKAVASILLSCSQRWQVGARSWCSTCFNILMTSVVSGSRKAAVPFQVGRNACTLLE